MKRKTRIERVYNEDTGWFETREVDLNGYSFTDDDRIMIVREYMESGLPAEEIIKKYYISSRTVLFSWMDKFLNEKDLLSLPPEDQNRDDMAKTTNEQFVFNRSKLDQNNLWQNKILKSKLQKVLDIYYRFHNGFQMGKSREYKVKNHISVREEGRKLEYFLPPCFSYYRECKLNCVKLQ